MIENELISIIIPVYNAEKTIERCVQSVINQSYSNIEIILVNDGSLDKSLYLCERLASIDIRVKIINSENNGVSNARNLGINAALGKYIMFVDSDDYVDEKWCETLILNLSLENELVVSNIYCVDYDNGEIYVENNLKCSNYKLLVTDFYKVFKWKLLNQPYNKIYSTYIIKKYNIKFSEDLSLGEDLLFNLEYLKYCDRITIINSNLYYYIKGKEDSLCNRYYNNLYEIQTKLYLKMRALLESNSPKFEMYKQELYTDYLFTLINCIQNVFSKQNKENIVQKYIQAKEIIISKEFDDCIYNSNIYCFNYILGNILKIKSIILLEFYYILCNLKSKYTTKRINKK